MIGAIILGAGESKRMGEPKLLIEISGERVIDRIVDSFEAIVDETLVVLGYKPKIFIPVLEDIDIKWIINEDYKDGMLSSIKKGINHIRDCDAAFIALGDQPIIKRDFLIYAIKAWRNGAKLVSPIYRGKKGHPVLFDKSVFKEILCLDKDETLRKVIHSHDDDHKLIQTGKWAVTDFNTPDDYEMLKRNFKTLT